MYETNCLDRTADPIWFYCRKLCAAKCHERCFHGIHVDEFGVCCLESELRPTLRHSAAIAAQIDDSLPMFLDCDHNPDCVFNRYVGVSRGIETAATDVSGMSRDFRRDWPAYLKTWQDIGVQTDGFVANMNRLTQPHWYDRLIG